MRFNGVVFSGLPGSGKSELVKQVAEIYGWQEFSIGGVWRERWQKLYPAKEITFEDYWRNVSFEESRQINVEALEIYKKGNIVSDSRYSIYLSGLPLLLVFITADLKTRSARAFNLSKYPNKNLQEIEQILKAREQDELKTGFDLFGYDYRDSNYYHLILNSGYLTIEQEIKIIRGALES